MKIPDFEPRLIIPHNYRKVYVEKDKKRYIVEYINSLEEGREIIQRTFDNWNACKNYLLAENFIVFRAGDPDLYRSGRNARSFLLK